MWIQLRVGVAKYGAIAGINLQNQLAYVWDTISRSTHIVVFMFIFTQLWGAVYRLQDVTEINGLTLANTIWYFLMAEVLQIGQIRHDTQITEEIKSGAIAYTLGKPYNYLGYHFSNGMGETIVKMGLLWLLGSPIALAFAGWPDVRLAHLPAIAVVYLLAIVVNFCIISLIGLMAFLIEDTFSLRLIYQKIVFILGGLLIPLDFLPEGLQRVAGLLPFQLTTYAPARLFVGFEWPMFWRQLQMGAIWLAILLGLLSLQYRWAARRLAINGG